jgi:zinc protease
MTNHNPRNKAMTTEDLAKVGYDRILEMAKEQTANAAAYTFTIIGNYDEEAIRPLIETYLASLPAHKNVVKSPKVSTIFKGEVINSFKHKSESPKAYAVMEWYTKELPMTAENDIKMDMIGQILSMEYLKKIREDASAAYTVQAMAGIDRNDFETTAQILSVCPMKPEKSDTAIMILRDEVTALAKTCDPDKLQKVKEYMLKEHGNQLKQNGYWLGVINTWRRFGLDIHSDYEKLVNAQTPESISALTAELLKAGNRAEVIMLPAEE